MNIPPSAAKGAIITLACLAFSVAGSMVHAQNPPPTDTAPGVANAAVSLLPNSDFSQDTQGKGWPDGWGKGEGITWETENGKHFLRLTSLRPGQMLMAYREIPVPAGVKAAELTVRYRTAGVKKGENPWFDARTIIHCLDAERKQVKPDPGTLNFKLDTQEWTLASKQFLIPEGTQKIQLMPSLFRVAEGLLDFAEIRIVAIDASAVSSK